MEPVENVSNRVELTDFRIESSQTKNQFWKFLTELSFKFLFWVNFFMIFKSEGNMKKIIRTCKNEKKTKMGGIFHFIGKIFRIFGSAFAFIIEF